MEIIDFKNEHIKEASILALQTYEEECIHVPALPKSEAVPDLTSFADNGLGAAAFDGGKMVGFLCCCPPFDNAFGTTNAKGVFSPMGTNAAIKENRAKIYAAMYQAAAVKWVKAEATSHAICLYAHDEEVQRQFYRYGFGLRCMDAIRYTKEIETAASACPYEIRLVHKSETVRLRSLRQMLNAHLGQSPCFMHCSPERAEDILTMVEDRSTYVFACFDNGLPIAFLEVGDDGETFASQIHGVKNICGAFCLPEYRGNGMMQRLINLAVSTMKSEGYTHLGVDFESINPTAYSFWLKYFTPYTHGVVRRIDESAVKFTVKDVDAEFERLKELGAEIVDPPTVGPWGVKKLTLLQKPTIWQRSTVPFWDDDHISKGMLEAHLNPDWDAASRKHEMIDHSVKWLSTIIPTGGKILDIGCGPGLYAKRLSNMGYEVTGMDFSKRSIAYAKEHDTKSEYIYQNYLEMDYTNVFDAVLLIYCDYAALTLPERKILLSKVYRALKPGGLFLFDVFTEEHFKSKRSRTNWSVHQNGGFWSNEPYICMEATHLYEDDKVAVDQSVILTANSMTEYLIWDTAYTKQRLLDEVQPNHFQVKGLYDDVCGSPYTGEAETLCIVLERKE